MKEIKNRGKSLINNIDERILPIIIPQIIKLSLYACEKKNLSPQNIRNKIKELIKNRTSGLIYSTHPMPIPTIITTNKKLLYSNNIIKNFNPYLLR